MCYKAMALLLVAFLAVTAFCQETESVRDTGPPLARFGEPIVVSELAPKEPDTVALEYRVAEPLGYIQVRIEMSSQSRQILQGEIVYGATTRLELPAELLQCLPEPRVLETRFLVTSIASNDSNWPRTWSNQLQIFYGETSGTGLELTADSGRYPFIAFDIDGMEVTRAVIWQNLNESRIVKPVLNECPTAVIDWSTQ